MRVKKTIPVKREEEEEQKTKEPNGPMVRARWPRCMAVALGGGGESNGQKCWVGM
jgi:hypothetical protein